MIDVVIDGIYRKSQIKYLRRNLSLSDLVVVVVVVVFKLLQLLQ